MRTKNEELSAIAKCSNLIAPLDREARNRVMEYLKSRFPYEVSDDMRRLTAPVRITDAEGDQE